MTERARRQMPVINRLHGLWSLGTAVGGLVSVQAASLGVPLQTHLVVASGFLLFMVMFVGSGLLRQDEHVAISVASEKGNH